MPLPDTLRAIAGDGPVSHAWHGLLADVRRLVGARRAFVAVRSRAADALLMTAADGLTPNLSEADELAACGLAIEPAIRMGRIVSTPDAMRDDRFREIGTRAGMEIRSLAAVPILVRGRAAGALCLHHDIPRDIAENEFLALADLATAASVVLELTTLRDERSEDDLIGGLTPRLFQQRLIEEVDRAVKHGRPLALIALSPADPAADAPAIARKARAALGSCAFVARVSPDPADRRLMALVLEADRPRGLEAARNLREALRPQSAAMGIAFMPGDALDVETLLVTAQEALSRSAPDRIFEFEGSTPDTATPPRPLASREARALATLLAHVFDSDLDLQRQLDLAAAWIRGAVEARRTLLAVIDEDGRWYLHGTSGLTHEEAPAFAGERAPFPVMDDGRLTAQVWLDPVPAAGFAQTLVEALADRIGGALRESVRLQRHRNDVRARREAVARTLDELRRKYDFSTIVGESPRILEALEIVVKAAPTDAPVLISGESGTGKELMARAVHANSPRRTGPFVVMNCAAVPPALLESELFGHVKGAFTGAIADRKGLFESADGGTLFLDEVADTTLELQAKLLRALQFGEVQPVGSDAVRRVSVRIVAASNKPLADEVKARRFREDLYYRINVFRIHVPPLRERPEDVARLVSYFSRKFAQEMKREVPAVDPAVVETLKRYPFPGNVRELENVMLRAFAYATGGTITTRDLPEEVASSAVHENGVEAGVPRNAAELERMKKEAEDRLEVAFLTAGLRASGGVVTQAAKITGFNRTSLQKLLAKHGLKAEDFRKNRGQGR